MNREELDIIKAIVEEAYMSNDYVNWTFVNACEDKMKGAENETER